MFFEVFRAPARGINLKAFNLNGINPNADIDPLLLRLILM